MTEQSPRHIDTDQIAAIIAQSTTFTPADVIGVIYALTDTIADQTRQNTIVNLQPFGRFARARRNPAMLHFTTSTRIKQKLN